MEKMDDIETGIESNIHDLFSSSNQEADDVAPPSAGEQGRNTSVQETWTPKEDTLPSIVDEEDIAPKQSISEQESNMPMLLNEEHDEHFTKHSDSEENVGSAGTEPHIPEEDTSMKFNSEDQKEDGGQPDTSALDERTLASMSDTGDARIIEDSTISQSNSSASASQNDVSLPESTEIPDLQNAEEATSDTSLANQQSPDLLQSSTSNIEVISESAVDVNVPYSLSQSSLEDHDTPSIEPSVSTIQSNEQSSETTTDNIKDESDPMDTSTQSLTPVQEETLATSANTQDKEQETDTCEEPPTKKTLIMMEDDVGTEATVVCKENNPNLENNCKQENAVSSVSKDVSRPTARPMINRKISGSTSDEEIPATKKMDTTNLSSNGENIKPTSKTQTTMGEGITEDAVGATKQPVIIREAQKEVGKLDLLVCGNCHEVFFFAEQFSEHKSANKCQTASEVIKTSEGENKAQIWAYNLWKQKQQRVKNDSENSTQSPWLYYQRWCKLSSAEREPWVKAGESLLWQNTMMTARLKELREIKPASPVKDPLALDDIVERETEMKVNSPVKQADQKPVIVKKEDPKDTKQASADKSAVRTTTEPTQEQQFVVERILAKRFTSKRKTWEYKIKWENFPEEESTWEPLAHLKTCKALVDEFEDNLRKMKVEKLKQAVASPVRGRGRPRLTASPSTSMLANSSADRLVGSRPQRSSKQKALNQVKAWCGNMSDAEGTASGIKRPYEEDSSDDSFGKKLKLGGETDDSEDEMETKFSPPKKTVPKATIVNNGVGNKLPDNILIPDAKGVVRINQKQLPSLSSGVYIMSKTAGIIKLDSATSKMATSAGQAMIKVAPKIGQTHIKIVKKDGGTASKVIPMQKAILPKMGLIKQPLKASPKVGAAAMSKVKKTILHEKPKLSSSNVIEKAMAEITGEAKPEEKAQQSDSDYGLEEMEFPADLPLPDPESPPGEFVLDPITGKIAGREYPDPPEEPEIMPAPEESLHTETDIKTDIESGTVADNSLDNLVKLAAADITEDDLQPLPESGVMETSGGESAMDTSTATIQPKTEIETPEVKPVLTPESKTIITVTSKEMRAGGNILQQTLQTAGVVGQQPKIQQRVLNQTVATRPGTFTTVVRSVATPRKVIAAPKPKFQISSQARPIGESPRMQYGKPGIPRKIGSTTIYKSVTNIRKEPMKQPVKRVSAVYHGTPSSYKGSPVVTYKSAAPTYRQSPMMKTQQTVYRTPPKKEPVLIRSTISPKKPKPIISMPSLSAEEEPIIEGVHQVATVAATQVEEPSVAAAPAVAETDLSSFTLASNEPPIFLTGDDGTVYQVAGQDEQGQTILITQGADGQQQCLLVTSEGATDDAGQQAEAPATATTSSGAPPTATAPPTDIEEPLTIKTDDTQQDQVVAQVVRTEPPSPGGTHKVVVMLPDGNLMVTQVTPEEYASLELDK